MKYNYRHTTLWLFSVLFTHYASAEEELVVRANSAAMLSTDVSTATRTSTPIKFVPQTIESISADALTAFGQPTLSEALAGVPGINASGDTRFDGVMIRGFNASNDFYLDGFRDDMHYTRDLSNIERVEILKGPAAVLYGRGSGGGIINRVSKKPGKDQQSSISTQVGSYGFKRIQSDLNGQINNDFLFRLNAAQEKKHSFRHGVSGDRAVLAPSISWQITPDLNWLLQYEYHNNERTPDRGIPGVNGRPARVDKRKVYSDTRRDYIDDTVQSGRSRLAYDINYHWQLRHALSWSQLKNSFDNTYVTGVSDDNARRARWQQQLNARNLISNLEVEGLIQTGAVDHQLLVGIEQSWQKRAPTLYQNQDPIEAQNLYHPEDFVQYNGPMKLSSDSKHQVRGKALYLQDQIVWNDWRLLIGGRYDSFTVTTARYDKGLQETRNSDKLSPRVGLVWNPLEEHAIYASFSKSYLPVGGGLIGITPDNRNNVLPPEQVRQVETGLKSDWLGGNLSSMLSLYRLEMYNRRTSDPENPGVVLLTGLQRTDGVELSLTAKLTQSFWLRGGIAYQDASLVRAEQDVQGNLPARVSRHNGSLYLGYSSPRGWFGETGFTAVGKRYADDKNTTLIPGYIKMDARAGYNWQDWMLQVSVDNLLDTDYYLSATSSVQIVPGSPRQLNVTASYKF